MAITAAIMGATPNIMPIRAEPGLRRPPGPGAFAVPGLAALMAAGLLWLALPRTLAALAGLEGDAVISAPQLTGGRADGDALAAGVASLESSAAWHGAGLTHIDHGLLLLRQSRQASSPAEQQRLLDAAALRIEQGLAQAPGNPSAWAQLAHIRARRGDRAGAGAALRLSMLTGAVTPSIMPSRLALGLYLLDGLDTETRTLLAGQVRLTWGIHPDSFAGLSHEPAGQAFIRRSLADLSDEAVSDYAKRLEQGR